MADAAKRHLRLAKTNVGTHVSVSKDYFHESAPINEWVYGSVINVFDNGLGKMKWEVDNTQSLVAPSDFQINKAGKNGSLPERYVQEQTVTKQRKIREPTALNIINSLTVNDAIDSLSNSNKWAGADTFICPPHCSCSDEDSADGEDPQLHDLSWRQLLSQCEQGFKN